MMNTREHSSKKRIMVFFDSKVKRESFIKTQHAERSTNKDTSTIKDIQKKASIAFPFPLISLYAAHSTTSNASMTRTSVLGKIQTT